VQCRCGSWSRLAETRSRRSWRATEAGRSRCSGRSRGTEGPASDIDFLVELEPGTRPFELLALGVELEDALGVRVDIGTPESLRTRIRDEVLAEAVTL
jgi:predicted nucleotidyltransferase